MDDQQLVKIPQQKKKAIRGRKETIAPDVILAISRMEKQTGE